MATRVMVINPGDTMADILASDAAADASYAVLYDLQLYAGIEFDADEFGGGGTKDNPARAALIEMATKGVLAVEQKLSEE